MTREEMEAERDRLREAARYEMWKRANAAPFGQAYFLAEANNLTAQADAIESRLSALKERSDAKG